MRKDILEQKELILQMIDENYSKEAIAKVLNCKNVTLNSYLKKMGIEYSGNMSGRGFSKDRSNSYTPACELLNKNSTIASSKLKKKLFREKLIEPICSSCKMEEWMGKPIPLELDHIDGDNTNNEFSNLRLLCPNCHAQTDTYRGKNIKKRRQAHEIELILKENKPTNQIKKCKGCGCNYSGRAKSFCSKECQSTKQRTFEITKEELYELVWSKPTTQIAEMFNVSDKAIAKRCELLGVEKPPRGYWAKKKAGK